MNPLSCQTFRSLALVLVCGCSSGLCVFSTAMPLVAATLVLKSQKTLEVATIWRDGQLILVRHTDGKVEAFPVSIVDLPATDAANPRPTPIPSPTRPPTRTPLPTLPPIVCNPGPGSLLDRPRATDVPVPTLNDPVALCRSLGALGFRAGDWLRDGATWRCEASDSASSDKASANSISFVVHGDSAELATWAELTLTLAKHSYPEVTPAVCRLVEATQLLMDASGYPRDRSFLDDIRGLHSDSERTFQSLKLTSYVTRQRGVPFVVHVYLSHWSPSQPASTSQSISAVDMIREYSENEVKADLK
jgi:hypothetical protein